MSKRNYTPIADLIKKNSKNISLPKEVEPIGMDFEIKEPSEDRIEEELRPFVSPRSETIELPPDLKKMGLQSVSAVKFPNYKNIKLPIDDEKIIVGQKAPITSSIRWLSTLALYILSQAHLGLKVVKGHVVRVLKV